MNTGEWKLILAVVEPGNSVTIIVEASPLGGYEPECFESEGCLAFAYKDGRRSIWPLASLLHAEFTPPGSGSVHDRGTA